MEPASAIWIAELFLKDKRIQHTTTDCSLSHLKEVHTLFPGTLGRKNLDDQRSFVCHCLTNRDAVLSAS